MTRNNVIAVVEKIVETNPDGTQLPHGPYAVARSLTGDREPITFSLTGEVDGIPIWQEDRWPVKGDMVVLDDVRRRPEGLRAYSARFSD